MSKEPIASSIEYLIESRPGADDSAFDVGLRIIQWRKLWSMSQRELARRADVTNGALSQIEQGKTSPSLQTLQKIASAFGVTLEVFLFGKQYRPLSTVKEKDTTRIVLENAVIQSYSRDNYSIELYRCDLPQSKSLTEMDLLQNAAFPNNIDWYLYLIAGAVNVSGGSLEEPLYPGDVCLLHGGSAFAILAAVGNYGDAEFLLAGVSNT